MTNLEAFLKALNWSGGTFHQVDKEIWSSLVHSMFISITELRDMSDWLDLIIDCHSEHRELIKQAYSFRWGELIR